MRNSFGVRLRLLFAIGGRENRETTRVPERTMQCGAQHTAFI
jgi:hypothetical protein